MIERLDVGTGMSKIVKHKGVACLCGQVRLRITSCHFDTGRSCQLLCKVEELVAQHNNIQEP